MDPSKPNMAKYLSRRNSRLKHHFPHRAFIIIQCVAVLHRKILDWHVTLMYTFDWTIICDKIINIKCFRKSIREISLVLRKTVCVGGAAADTLIYVKINFSNYIVQT